MFLFFSRFFRDAKCLYYLLTLKDELHLVSIENSVVKKNKREREQQKKIRWQRPNECTKKSTMYCFSFQLSLAFVCTITVVSIHGVNSVIESHFFLSLLYISLLFKHRHFLQVTLVAKTRLTLDWIWSTHCLSLLAGSGVTRNFWVMGHFTAKLFWGVSSNGQLKTHWATFFQNLLP
jgi:hypothetical protein